MLGAKPRAWYIVDSCSTTKFTNSFPTLRQSVHVSYLKFSHKWTVQGKPLRPAYVLTQHLLNKAVILSTVTLDPNPSPVGRSKTSCVQNVQMCARLCGKGTAQLVCLGVEGGEKTLHLGLCFGNGEHGWGRRHRAEGFLDSAPTHASFLRRAAAHAVVWPLHYLKGADTRMVKYFIHRTNTKHFQGLIFKDSFLFLSV